MTSPLLTAEQVAEILGMGSDWILGEARADRIPHVRLGRYVRFRAESIETWIADLERGTMGTLKKRRGAAGTAPGMAQEVAPS